MVNNDINTTMIKFIILFSIAIIIFHIYSDKERKKYLYRLKKGKRVVVSLTTSPTRIAYIKDTLDSIQKQTIVPDLIYLNLPKVFKRTNDKFKNPLPQFITTNPSIIVNVCEDNGPATKVLPVLQYEKKKETFVISIDDDMVYDSDLIESMLQLSEDFPNSVITNSSYIIDFYRQKMNTRSDIKFVQLLEGFSGVLYKVKFIYDFDISILSKTIKECYVSDDVMLSNHILGKGFSIIQNHKIPKILEYGLKGDALHQLKDTKELSALDEKNIHNIKYTKCAKWLDTHGLLNLKIKNNIFTY